MTKWLRRTFRHRLKFVLVLDNDPSDDMRELVEALRRAAIEIEQTPHLRGDLVADSLFHAIGDWSIE